MTTNTGGPAFPTARVNINGVDEQDGISAFGAGMTLRDYFAASFVTSGHVFTCLSLGDTPEQVAEQAYALADSMLKARQA